MKDKVKRRRIVKSRKVQNILQNPDIARNSHELYEAEQQQKLLLEQQRDLDNITLLELKLRAAKQQSKLLNKQFLRYKRKEYKSLQEFYSAYKNIKQKRHEVYLSLKKDLDEMKDKYNNTYEVIGFRVKRWFFGMGKEFNRIQWLQRRKIFINLIIVLGISVFLAAVFFIIDIIFGIL